MKIKLFEILLVGCLCLLAAGCSPAATTEPITTPGAPATLTTGAGLKPTITETPVNENVTPSPYDPAMQPLIDQAIADLGERLRIDPAEIEVLSAEAVVWPDSSYGCPQPGMEYLQVPQDGALIRLLTAGSEYNYHSGAPRGLFLCKQTLKIKETPPLLETFAPPPEGEDT